MIKRWHVLLLVVVVAMAVRGAGFAAQLGPGGPPPPNTAIPPTAARFPNLTWNASLTANVTYDAYRGVTPGGPYGKVNTAPITSLTYRDATAAFGQLNYYVVLAKDVTNISSVYSNEVSATAVAPTTGSPAPATQLNAVVAFFVKVGRVIWAGLRHFGGLFS